MNIPFYTEAISSLRPGCVWRLVGDDVIENLEWNDENNLQPPTHEEIVEEAKRLEIEYQSKEYQFKRKQEYPPLSEFADAYYWMQEGDDTKMNAYIEKCKQVKNKWPKP